MPRNLDFHIDLSVFKCWPPIYLNKIFNCNVGPYKTPLQAGLGNNLGNQSREHRCWSRLTSCPQLCDLRQSLDLSEPLHLHLESTNNCTMEAL